MRIRGKSMEAWNGAAAAYHNVEQGFSGSHSIPNNRTYITKRVYDTICTCSILFVGG